MIKVPLESSSRGGRSFAGLELSFDPRMVFSAFPTLLNLHKGSRVAAPAAAPLEPLCVHPHDVAAPQT